MSTRQLAARLTDLDRPIPATGITRIEKGTRSVDVDDLVTLAVALSVSPLTLLLPPTSGPTNAEMTTVGELPSWKAWRWARAVEPLSEPYTEAEYLEFQTHAAPKEVSAAPPWEHEFPQLRGAKLHELRHEEE